MPAEVIDRQLFRIRKDLDRRGVTYDPLKDDLVDHICCMVEERLGEGYDFESSYGEVMSGIEAQTLTELQHDTLLLLDKKFQRMKRITYLLGITGAMLAIIGALFKMMHWPYASILLTLGFLIVVLGFLPFYFIGSYREQSEKPNIIFPIVGYLSLLIVFTGAVFKIMHWPGANIMLRISVIVLLVGFLPLYIVQIFKRSVKSKVNPAYFIMLLIGIAVVLVLSRVNLSKDAIDIYTGVAVEYSEYAENVNDKIAEMTATTGDSSVTPEVVKIMEMSDELEQLTDRMLAGLLASVDQEGKAISNVSGRDYKKGSRNAYVDNGLADEFLQKARVYRDQISGYVEDPVEKGEVALDLQFAEETYIKGWMPEDDVNEPLIKCYSRIAGFRYGIVHAEYLAVRQLLNE